MSEVLTKETLQFIIGRLLERAKEAVKEAHEDREDAFKSGRSLAYYEVLDIIKSQLNVADQDLKEYGLDINLEKEFI